MKRPALLLTTALTSLMLLSACDDKTADISWYDALKTLITGEVPQKYLVDGMSDEARQYLAEQYPARTATGSYLSGRFAQSNFDWDTASKFFTEAMAGNLNNTDLERRTMALSMGAGNYQDAFDYARKVIATGETGSLPKLFLTLETFKSGNYSQTVRDLQKVPEDGVSEFIKPLFMAWSQAGLKKLDISTLNKNIVHFYHAILIADYLNDEPTIKRMAMRDYSRMGLSSKSLREIARIFEKHGLTAQAKEVLRLVPASDLANADPLPPKIQTPQEGMGRALFDMATILYQDYPDSAQLFAEMSLYLDPNQDEPRILMAHMAAQFKKYDQAISILNEVDYSKDPALERKLKRQIADFLVQSGRTDDAIKILRDIVNASSDINAQIQIGDIYRQQENFKAALPEYNKAFKMLNGQLKSENWNLLYARGICNERLKNWDEAEKDLKSALALEPDQPYILNYLGYSWIDQGINMDEATRMIEKAVRLKPDDGFIVDSLGWAYYKRGKYPLAVEALERAVELSADDATINDHLGDAYWQVGRHNEARFQWQRALSLNPDADLAASLDDKIEKGITVKTKRMISGQATTTLPTLQ